MFTGWISLKVLDLWAISDWYREVTGLQVVGARDDTGSIALGSKNLGYAIILLPDESMDRPENLRVHFPATDVDAEYDRLTKRGIKFDEPSEDKSWVWRHAYTHGPAGHTVELCTPLADAKSTS
jgi:catechol 2,3-dioxygenase-like lactoylglutathione lyase family enzyme